MSRRIDWNKLNYEVEEIFEDIELVKPIQKIKKKAKIEDKSMLTGDGKKKNDRKLSIYK